MIERLTPDGVHTAESAIVDDAALHPAEEPLAAAMSPRRRAEFASGRACARRALAELGLGEAPVGRGERRMPVWPHGVVGALTHRDGWCAAAVGRADAWLGIGLDAEPWQPLSRRALERITHASERDALLRLPDAPSEHWGTVLFSAKESLYKALFPQTRLFLGFRDAEISLAPSTRHAGTFSATLLHGESIARTGRDRFEGRFARDATGGRLWTFLAVPH